MEQIKGETVFRQQTAQENAEIAATKVTRAKADIFDGKLPASQLTNTAMQFFEVAEEDDFYEQFEEGTLKDGFHTLNVYGLKRELVDDSGDAFAMTNNQNYIISSHFEDTGVVIKFRNKTTNVVTEKVLNNFKNKENASVNSIGVIFKWNSNNTILYILYTYLTQSGFEANPRRDVLYSFDISSLENSFQTVQTFTNLTNNGASYGMNMPANLIEGANDTYIIGSYNLGFNSNGSFLFVYSLKTNTFYYNVTGTSAGAGTNHKTLLGEENSGTVTSAVVGLQIKKVLTKNIDNVVYDFLQIYHETLVVKPDNTFTKIPNSIYTGLGKKFIEIPTSDRSGTDSIYFASTHTYVIKEYDFATETFNESLNQNLTLNGTIRQFVANAKPNATLLISYRMVGNAQFNYYSIKLESGNISVVNTLLAPTLKFGQGFGESVFIHNYFSGKFLNQNAVIYRIEDNLTATKIYDFIPTSFAANAFMSAKGTTKTGLNYFLFSTYVSGSGGTVRVLFENENNLSLLSSKTQLATPLDTSSVEYLFRALTKESIGFSNRPYNFVSASNNILYYDNFERVEDFEFADYTYVRNGLGTSKGSRTFVGERQNLFKTADERIFYIDESYRIIELKNEDVLIKVKGQLVKNNLIISQTL